MHGILSLKHLMYQISAILSWYGLGPVKCLSRVVPDSCARNLGKIVHRTQDNRLTPQVNYIQIVRIQFFLMGVGVTDYCNIYSNNLHTLSVRVETANGTKLFK